MKTKIILMCVGLICHFVSAQPFQKKLSIKLDTGTQILQTRWVDVDNDSLLDIILASTHQNQVYLLAYHNLLQGPPQKMILAPTGYASARFTSMDLDQDNKIDLVLSGVFPNGSTNTQAFLNQGEFVFQNTNSLMFNTSTSNIQFADLNNDGQKDAI